MKQRKKFGAILLLTVMLLCSCSHPDPSNSPYDPGTPVPADHEGTFVSPHGSMTFNGDGESVVLDFDEELRAMLELQDMEEGEQEGTYVFLSGDLPPHGSYPIRYDVAHEMQLTVEEQSVVVVMGLASEDGSTGTVGVDVVTPERIPMMFRIDGKVVNVIFEKEDR